MNPSSIGFILLKHICKNCCTVAVWFVCQNVRICFNDALSNLDYIGSNDTISKWWTENNAPILILSAHGSIPASCLEGPSISLKTGCLHRFFFTCPREMPAKSTDSYIRIIIYVLSVLGLLHCVNMGDVADFPLVHAASIFRFASVAWFDVLYRRFPGAAEENHERFGQVRRAVIRLRLRPMISQERRRKALS